MEEDAMVMWNIWGLPHSAFFGFLSVAIFGVAAADGQVQIEMRMMCQTGAVARDNEGLAFTNPHRGCPGITASIHIG